MNQFDYKDDVKNVEIDLTNAHLWDDSAIGALDKIEQSLNKRNYG